MGFKCEQLLKPVQLGDLKLQHRVVMAPMTRLRNDPVLEAPGDLNILYYTQRASKGGLIITEGVYPVPEGRGYVRQPGIYTEEQIQAWKKVTDSVHEKGSGIFCQLMHAGRVTHSSLLPDNQLPVAPSAVKAIGLVHIHGNDKKDRTQASNDTGKAPYEVPRALEIEEIPLVVASIAEAAKRAIQAGFDGVELHSGNGYLLQEFLAEATNIRTDAYGGTVQNRARFVLEVVDACIQAIGSHRVGIKLQPGITFSSLIETEEDSLEQLRYLGPELEKRKLAYVCLSSLNYDPYYRFLGLPGANFKTDVWRYFRTYYHGILMINGGLSPQQGEEYVKEGTADLVCFAMLYIANANLPELLATGQELNMGGRINSVWYGRKPDEDAKGYTDWPLVDPHEIMQYIEP